MKIGLVPISAKPYHAGHHTLVKRAASENDRVFLFVSVSDRVRKNEFPIMGDTMRHLWVEVIEPSMPSNVVVEYGGSPVRKVYEAIEEAAQRINGDIYTIYSDVEDTKANYPVQSRIEYMSPMYENGQVVFAAEHDPAAYTRGVGTPNVRGQDLRLALAADDFSTFSKFIPPDIDAEIIYNTLRESVDSKLPTLADVYFGGQIG